MEQTGHKTRNARRNAKRKEKAATMHRNDETERGRAFFDNPFNVILVVRHLRLCDLLRCSGVNSAWKLAVRSCVPHEKWFRLEGPWRLHSSDGPRGTFYSCVACREERMLHGAAPSPTRSIEYHARCRGCRQTMPRERHFVYKAKYETTVPVCASCSRGFSEGRKRRRRDRRRDKRRLKHRAEWYGRYGIGGW